MKKLLLSLSLTLAALSVAAESRHPAMHYDRYHNDYTQSFVTKIFLKAKTGDKISTTLDQCRDLIRRTWELSGGMHQIIYLDGWQYNGHDSHFPSWDKVGDQCRSSWSQDPLESLRMLMREARAKYNCDVSLHLNMNDAHEESPDWKTYVDNRLLCFDKAGKPRMLDCGSYKWYRISHVKEWKSGFAKKRIDALLEMIPELKAAKSVHIDAFFAQDSPGDGISIEDDKAAVKAITDYWHERGIDVTNEFITSEDMIGYFPMVYHYNLDERQRMLYPVEVLAPGDDVWNVRLGRDYFGSRKKIHGPVNTSPSSGSVYEEAWGLGCFCDMHPGYLSHSSLARRLFRAAFLFAWYNRHPLVEHVVTPTDYKVRRTDGVEANVRMRDRHLTVREKDRVVVDGGDFFLDQPWNGGVILAYSEKGCDRSFDLPTDWTTCACLSGTRYPAMQSCSFPVVNGKVQMKLSPHESLVLKAVR